MEERHFQNLLSLLMIQSPSMLLDGLLNVLILRLEIGDERETETETKEGGGNEIEWEGQNQVINI